MLNHVVKQKLVCCVSQTEFLDQLANNFLGLYYCSLKTLTNALESPSYALRTLFNQLVTSSNALKSLSKGLESLSNALKSVF